MNYVKRITIGIGASIFLLGYGIVSPAAPQQPQVLLEDIVAHPGKFDNKTISVEGEVIGDRIADDTGGVWINIARGASLLGVYVPDVLWLKDIAQTGSYRCRGDMIRVKGVFHKTCPCHFEQDIHAVGIDIVKKGECLSESVSSRKMKISSVMAGIFFVLAMVYLIRIKHVSRN